MAVIINGEVVSDDDPRAVRYRSRGSVHRNNNPAPAPPMNRTASLGSEVQGDARPQNNLGLPEPLFQFNQRLELAGVPKIRLSPQMVIEPVMLVLCLVAGLIFGLQGALFVALMFAFMMYNNR
ncbi:protein FAM241B-like [Bolinopsis microptera]|uniref:protein FAM241B-like n=1 Tax=Bolinopsis microptera TaxID=2820187 RepID=UPI00307AB4CA